MLARLVRHHVLSVTLEPSLLSNDDVSFMPQSAQGCYLGISRDFPTGGLRALLLQPAWHEIMPVCTSSRLSPIVLSSVASVRRAWVNTLWKPTEISATGARSSAALPPQRVRPPPGRCRTAAAPVRMSLPSPAKVYWVVERLWGRVCDPSAFISRRAERSISGARRPYTQGLVSPPLKVRGEATDST